MKEAFTLRFILVKSKTLKWLFTACLVCFLLTLNIFNGNTAASVFFGNTVRKVPIYAVSTSENKVAISFDAAWGSDKTQKIMNILKEHNVNATFFLVGFWAEDYPDMVKAIDEAGFEIGLHSNTHPDLTKLSAVQIELELTTNQNILKKITGKTHTLFRPPFGAYNDTLISVCEKLGLTTIQWSVDSLDWKGLSGMEITNRIINKATNGSIILCHNNSDHILDALPVVLDRLSKKNLKVTNVGSLIYKENYYINSQGYQCLK